MKMRLLVLIALLPLVLVAPVSNAAVKAGSACTKQGVKQISAGKSFTCVKQGKKLIWVVKLDLSELQFHILMIVKRFGGSGPEYAFVSQNCLQNRTIKSDV